MEDRIQIDIHQIVKILQIGAGNRIDRLVRVGHGVEEGLERPLEQLDKRLFERILLRPTQHGMFHNVRNPRRVGRGGAEGNAEDLILIVICHRQQFGARLDMAIDAGDRLQLGNGLFTAQFKPVDCLHDSLLGR